MFLITIEAGGTLLLKFFGVSLPVVQVSGGLALAAMGWKLLNQEEPEEKEKPPDMDGPGMRSLEQKVFYHSRPGLYCRHGDSECPRIGSVIAHAGIVIAVVLLSVAVYFCYGHAPTITARMSPQTAHGFLRLIAFVLLCIGVQITSNGVEAIVKAMFLRT
jgi:multiple antibiotic resistance protein